MPNIKKGNNKEITSVERLRMMKDKTDSVCHGSTCICAYIFTSVLSIFFHSICLG